MLNSTDGKLNKEPSKKRSNNNAGSIIASLDKKDSDLKKRLAKIENSAEDRRTKDMLKEIAKAQLLRNLYKNQQKYGGVAPTPNSERGRRRKQANRELIDDALAFEALVNPNLNNNYIKGNAHYSQLIHENKKSLYYAHSSGYVYRVAHDKIKKTGGSDPSDWVRLRAKLKGNDWSIQIDGKHYALKQIIAKYFTRAWQPKYRIYFNDLDPRNCNINNLIIKEFNLSTNPGRHRKIMFEIDGEWVRFNSIQEAAKKMYVSSSTMKRFIYGWNATNKSTLNGYQFKFVEEDNK
jgi:hypothetical protein